MLIMLSLGTIIRLGIFGRCVVSIMLGSLLVRVLRLIGLGFVGLGRCSVRVVAVSILGFCEVVVVWV